MGKRMFLLILMLVLRAVIGGYLTADCVNGDLVKIAGKIKDIYQKNSKRYIRVGNFEIINEANLYYLRTQKVVVFGTCKRGVIDFLFSRITLIEPEIQVVGEKTFARDWWGSGGELVREKLVRIYQKYLNEPEASLVAGIVLGEKSNLPERFYQKLVATGTIHVVVASGYNLAVVGEFLFYILIYFVSRKWATGGALGGMFFYVWLTGWGIPTIRAFLMGGLVLVNKALGRSERTAWWLFLSVWLMLMMRPDLLENVSFQLSVTATVGLVVLEPLMRRLITSWVPGDLLPTLAAQVATAPVIWWHFGRLSWISPLVNVLILPLVPPIMLLGVLLLSLGGILGGVFSWLVAPFLYSLTHLMVVIIDWMGNFPAK